MSAAVTRSAIVKDEVKIPKINVGDTFLFEDNNGCYRIVRNVFVTFLCISVFIIIVFYVLRLLNGSAHMELFVT